MPDWVPSLISAASGLAGVVVGALGVALRGRKERRYLFLKRQVEEFYGPLVGLRHDVRAKAEVRVRVSNAAESAWRDLCKGKTPEQMESLKNDKPKFEQLIKYNNEQLERDVLPSYRQMLTLFREKWPLAMESTRSHYFYLVEYVEVWNRHFSAPLPPGLSEKLHHGEESLHPLYIDLEQNLKILSDQIRRGGESTIFQWLRTSWRWPFRKHRRGAE